MQDTLKSSAKRYYGLNHDRKANERNLNVGDKVLILLFKTICLKNGRDHSRLLVPSSVMTFFVNVNFVEKTVHINLLIRNVRRDEEMACSCFDIGACEVKVG